MMAWRSGFLGDRGIVAPTPPSDFTVIIRRSGLPDIYAYWDDDTPVSISCNPTITKSSNYSHFAMVTLPTQTPREPAVSFRRDRCRFGQAS